MVDPNRKINRLTDKDLEFLDECEEEFKYRFTENDKEFVEHCNKEMPMPPIIDPWTGRTFNAPNNQRFHRGSGGYRDNNRNFHNDRRDGRGGYNSRGYGRFQNRGRFNNYHRRDKIYARNDDYGRFGRNHQD